MNHPFTRLAALALFTLAAAGTAFAAPHPLGLYVGGSLGASQIQSFAPSAGSPSFLLDKNTTGWKVLVGIRPTHALGLELNYIDFGTAHLGPIGELYHANAYNTAVAGFLVGYFPLPFKRFDLFGKLGAAELRSHGDSIGNYPNTCISNPVTQTCDPVGVASASETHDKSALAYGVGAQWRFGSLGVRAEYERIHNSQNEPDLLSLGLTWRF
jgi:opacity protein-like surface antigen